MQDGIGFSQRFVPARFMLCGGKVFIGLCTLMVTTNGQTLEDHQITVSGVPLGRVAVVAQNDEPAPAEADAPVESDVTEGETSEPEIIAPGSIVGELSDFDNAFQDESVLYDSPEVILPYEEYPAISQPFPPIGGWWAARPRIFADYLLLRPGNTDVLYAIEQNDIVAGSFPTGPTGISQIGFASGYQVGVALTHHDTASWVASFSRWEGNTIDRMIRNGTNVLVSQIIHPSPQPTGLGTTGSTSLETRATQSIDFSLIDLGRRFHLVRTDNTSINWWGGIRYGQLKQSFEQQQQDAVAAGLVTVDTNLDFSGLGLRGGVDAERYNRQTRIHVYGHGFVSLLGGEWKGLYTQTNGNIGGGVIANRYDDFRITPVLDTELGLGWEDPTGRFRFRTGYNASFWGNAVNTSSYVAGVRSSLLSNLDETISFIGLRARLEFLY